MIAMVSFVIIVLSLLLAGAYWLRSESVKEEVAEVSHVGILTDEVLIHASANMGVVR